MHSTNLNQDRRRFKRVRVNLTVFYRVDEPLTIRLVIGGKEIEAKMLDLSEGGIAVLTKYDLPVSTVLLIRFTLFKVEKEDVSFYGPMEIIGDVRYNIPLAQNEYRVGICFTQIDEKDRQEINNFVKRVINLLSPENK